MTKAAVYVRISQDREGGGLGVDRQEMDCRKLAKRNGWTIPRGAVYIDNDVSATSGKPRPEWDRLMRDVEAGSVEAVVCWHVDRLTRSPAELEHLIDQAERLGLKLATATGEVDLATPTGRLVARMLGAAARHEIEHKVERQRRERQQSAERGEPNKGGTRPFGFENDRVTVRKTEAAIVCECARRVLQGESLSSIARDLERRAVKTPAGNGWQPSTLRRMLASARISGRREHRPRHSHGGTRPLVGEIVAESAWPAIISHDESDRLRALLTRPDRATKRAAGRTYLLSGILRCGRCGAGLVGRPRGDEPRYVCSNVPGTSSCGRLAATATRVDEVVREQILGYLDSPAFEKALRRARRQASGYDKASSAASRQLSTDRARLAELADDYDDGKVGRAEYGRRRDRLEQRIRDAEDSLRQLDSTGPATALAGRRSDVALAWDSATLDEKRTIVEALVGRIVVHPASKQGGRFDPSRIEMIWLF